MDLGTSPAGPGTPAPDPRVSGAPSRPPSGPPPAEQGADEQRSEEGTAMAHPGGPDTADRRRARRRAAWALAIAVLVLAGTGLFVAGFTLGRQTALTAGTPERLSADLQPFFDAFDSIDQRYAGVPVDRRKVIEGAIDGMFRALGDQFSFYMTGAQYRASLAGVSGQFEGIGAVITTEDPTGRQGCSPAGPRCAIVVDHTIGGSPAQRAGILPGDEIVAVDGVSVSGKTTADVVSLVRGPRGTQVVVSLSRAGRAFELRITREVINPEDVTSRLLRNGTVAYVRIAAFGTGVAVDFASRLHGLAATRSVRGILLDLRGNPGGLVDQARSVASQFIGSGPIYWQQVADGERTAYDAEPGGIATSPRLPVVVLVDRDTASAAELLAGAIGDSGRGTLVGTTTFGKGTVQEWQLLGQGMGGFRLTIARWLTPTGRWINGTGLTPQVAYTPPASAPVGSDPTLDRGLEVLGTLMGTGSASPPPAAFASTPHAASAAQ